MTSLPAVVTQDEVIDLTMENKDNEHMDESLDTMAITAHQSIENLDSQKSTNNKKLVQQDLYKHSSKKPVGNITMTQMFNSI